MADTVKDKLMWLLGHLEYQYCDSHSIIRENVVTYLMQNGVTVQNWIPVTERLPDTEMDYWEDEDGTRCAYEASEWVWGIDMNGIQARVRYETGPVFQGWYDDSGKTYAVTHWMSLPEAPKED